MNTQASDPLDVAQGYVDQARCGVGQSAALADGIRVGLADLAAAVRGVMAKPAILNEERWALLCERAAHVRAACQEMVTQLTATHTATTRAGTQLVRMDVNSLGQQARLQGVHARGRQYRHQRSAEADAAAWCARVCRVGRDREPVRTPRHCRSCRQPPGRRPVHRRPGRDRGTVGGHVGDPEHRLEPRPDPAGSVNHG